MARFDIITCVGLAYRTLWTERGYLARMAMIPFVIKLASYTVLATYFDGVTMWTTAIILLPAFLIEGWLLTHWARTIMTGGVHRWPFRPSGDDVKDFKELSVRSTGILGGTVAYALTNFLITGYFAFLVPKLPEVIDPNTSDPRLAVLGLIMMVTSLFMFRYLWLHISLSVNIKLSTMLKKLNPTSVMFKLIGVWLICVVPSFMATQLSSEAVFSVLANEQSDAMANAVSLVLRLMIDLIKSLICTAGIAFAFLALLQPSTTPPKA